VRRIPEAVYAADPLVFEQNNATGNTAYWQKGDNQSAADKNGVSLADYIHAMYGFLIQAKCRNVLMIGCGGGNLGTMLRLSGIAVTIVDIDPLSFAIAHRYFRLPDDVRTYVGDGVAFLRTHRERYDAIVLDAYAETSIPRQFLTASFFKLAKSRLKRRGAIFLMNIIVARDDDRTPDNIVRTMRKAWRAARLLDSDGWDNRNAVALAGAVQNLRKPRLLMPPARGAAGVAKGLRELRFRGLRR